MSKVTSYSLWLAPGESSDENRFLSQLIYKLSSVYKTPTFNPHVTLLGAVEKDEQEMRSKVQEFAGKLTSYEIKLGSIDSHGTYFQALFSKVDQIPEVLNAYNMAQKTFGLDKGKYFPHLSLAYGNFSDEQVGILGKFAEQEFKTKNISFLAKGVELWHTEGAPEEWHRVATFPFGES